jgi:hypothetical protein
MRIHLDPIRPTPWRVGLSVALLLLVPAGCLPGRINRVAGPQPDELRVPLQVVEGSEGQVLTLISVYIEDRGPFAFTLDTGASRSLISREIVNRLRLPSHGRAVEVQAMTSAASADRIRVEKWRVGDVPLPAHTLLALGEQATDAELGFSGLLGSDVLSEFGVITIDYKRQELTLRSRR